MEMQTRLACLLFLWLPFAAAEYTYVPSETYTDRANTSELAKIKFRVYTGKTIEEYENVLVGDALDLLDHIDPTKPTVFYTHGWQQTPQTDYVTVVIEAYLACGEENIVLADYSHIVGPDWDYTALSMRGIGYTLAEAISKLVAHGLNRETLRLVGYSIGGQMPGYISRFADFPVERIIALDPAKIPYTTFEDLLSRADAKHVTAIHTNPTYYGVNNSVGHADFWPNGDSGPQPGCEAATELDMAGCSHPRAPQYWAESVCNPEAFIAVPTGSFSSFTRGYAYGTPVLMGHATPTTAHGNHYLRTNAASPFGKGVKGVISEQ